MKRTLTFATMAVMFIAMSGGVGAYGAPGISFVEPPTPPDEATIEGTSVPIEVSIDETGFALTNVTFNWDSTDYIIYDDPLVMMFNFDNVAALGETDTYFVDLSRHNNNGVGLNFEGGEIVSGMSAEYGKAIDFDGVDDYVRIEDSAELNVITFTIEFWFYARNPTGRTQSLIARGEDLGFDIAQWVVELDDPQNPDTVQLWIEEGDDTDWHYGLNTRPSANTWYHYAVTRSSNGTVKVYLNGVKENEWTGQADPGIVPAPITIGARTNMSQADPQDYFDGIIDEVRTWNVALSEGQVAEHYMSNLRKYDVGRWTLYVNQSNLASGTYTYQASATNTLSETSTAGPRSVTMDAPPIQADIIKGPYLMHGGNNTSMTVLWQLNNTASCTINWGLGTDYSLGSATTTEYGDHQHAYTIGSDEELPPLSPGTKYYYEVVDVRSGSFYTAPDDSATDVKFLAFGDTRGGSTGDIPWEYDDVCAEMNVSASLGYQTMAVHVGDWIYSNSETDWGLFFDPSLTDALALHATVPIQGCIGNHEGSGTVYEKYYPYPYVDRFYWSFDYGPAHFAIVDQYISFAEGSPQYVWLDNDLANTPKQWKFIVLHEPGWTARTTYNGTVRTAIQPLCKTHGVDIVLAGHAHFYARCDVDGVQHITTGGGGAPLAGVDPTLDYVVACESSFQFCEIDIQGPTLTLVSRRVSNGGEIDRLVITRTSQASNPSPADGATGVNVDADLSWRAGIDAVSHDVYFGTEETAVADATTASPEFKGNQETTTYDPGPLDTGTTYYWAIDEHDSGDVITYGDVWSFTTARCVANADISVAGTVNGSYADTQSSDNVYEAITERQSGGKPSKRYSYLEHKWTFDVPARDTVTFYVEAYHTDNSEGDDFVFEYSLNDSDYTTLVTVTKTSDDGAYQSAPLPPSVSGTLYIRVKDTDRTQGQTVLDTIYIDHMYIESQGTPTPDTTPPTPPTGLAATAGNAQVTLDWDDNAESDLSGYNVYRSETEGGPYSQVNGALMTTSDYLDTGLTNETTYYYVITAVDFAGNPSGNSNEASATPTATAGDVVTITKAEYKMSRSELNVEATSSDGSTADLMVVGYEEYGFMTYDSRKDIYKLKIRPVDDPGGTVTVTSSLGGSDTAPVTYK